MIGQNRSPEAQYNLALQLPMDRLVAIMQGQPGPVDQPFALMALKQKRQEKTAAQGLQAQQELRQPTVAQQIASGLPENTGVGALAAPNMGGFADGGIIGMAGGGKMPYEPYRMYGPVYDPNADPAWLAPVSNIARRVRDVILPQSGEALSAYFTPEASPNAVQPAQSYTGRSPWEAAALAEKASPTPPTAAPASRTAPVRTRPSAAAPAAAGIAQKTVSGSEGAMYPGMDTGEAPASLAAEATAPAESPRRTASGIESIGSFQKALEQISGSTKPYVDRMTEVFKQMTPTAEEKEARGQERKGVMALKAAQALLQPGTTAAGARGSAMGQVANLVEAYGKEDREDKKAMLGAEINMLGAQAQLAQGNNKAALDMYQHAEKLAFEGIRLDAEKYYKQEELRLKRAGLDTEKEIALLRDRTQRYVVDEQAKWHKYHTDALASHGNRAEITAATSERNANLRALVDLKREQLKQIGLPAAEKKRLEGEIASISSMLSGTLGIASLARPSIQLPDTAGAGRPIYNLD